MNENDPPAVAAQIAEMRRGWDRRLGVNAIALVAIVAYFVYPTWGQPNFSETIMSVLPWAIVVGLLMFGVNRWFVARESRLIREAAAGARRV